MKKYTFTLQLPGITELTDAIEYSLYEAGCDDAVLWSRDGHVFVDFTRQAPTMREAVISAIANIQEAGIQV